MYSYPLLLAWLWLLSPAVHAFHWQQQSKNQGPSEPKTAREKLRDLSNRREVVVVTDEASSDVTGSSERANAILPNMAVTRETGHLAAQDETVLVLLSSGQTDGVHISTVTTRGSRHLAPNVGLILQISCGLILLAVCLVMACSAPAVPSEGKAPMHSQSASDSSTRCSEAPLPYRPRGSGGSAAQMLSTAGTLRTSSTLDSLQSSPPGSGWLNMTSSPAVPLELVLPTPLVVRSQQGEVFSVNGSLLPGRQQIQSIDIKNASGALAARLHITEEKRASGILMELVSLSQMSGARPIHRVSPFAFLDTALAKNSNEVAIFAASQAGWDTTSPTALPSAIIKATGQGRFAMQQHGQVMLSVVADANGELSRVEGKDSQLLAKVQSSGSGMPLTVHCAFGADAGLVLCAVVASTKLL